MNRSLKRERFEKRLHGRGTGPRVSVIPIPVPMPEAQDERSRHLLLRGTRLPHNAFNPSGGSCSSEVRAAASIAMLARAPDFPGLGNTPNDTPRRLRLPTKRATQKIFMRCQPSAENALLGQVKCCFKFPITTNLSRCRGGLAAKEKHKHRYRANSKHSGYAAVFAVGMYRD